MSKKTKKIVPIDPKIIEKQASKKVSRARIALMLIQPFFAPILSVTPSISDRKIPTMATNGLTILYNPEWVMPMTHEELQFVLAHEVMHIILLHHVRMKHRNPQIWNFAGDFAINPLVKDTTYFPMPDNALFDEKYENMTSEQIYEILMKDVKDAMEAFEKALKDGTPIAGDVLPYPSGKNLPEGAPTLEEHVDEIKQKANASLEKAGKDAGNLPGSLVSQIKGMLRPQVNWKALLAQYMEPDDSDYSWSRPNRRFISQGFYMPAKYGESVGPIGFVVDTSGSISEKEYTHFMTEFLALINNCKPRSLFFLQIDTAIAMEKEYTSDDYPIAAIPAIHGGGGTSFAPAFEYFAKQGTDLQCLVYMTDLYCDEFGDRPPFPVIWVNTSVGNKNQTDVPWGTVIDLKLDVGEA